MANTGPIERRRFTRVPTHGDVVFRGREHVIHGRVVALSEIALDVRCQLGFSILGMAGQEVDLAVVIDGAEGPWNLRGRVRTVRAATHTLVIEYDPPPAEVARVIASYLSESRDAAESLQLMLRMRDYDELEHRRIDDMEAQRIVDERRRPEPS
jgi:hypothetical protein